MCQFVIAWVGKCQSEGEPYCPEHTAMKCCSCGDQSTHSCEETMGFICGCPLCANCEHKISPDGTNGRSLIHCKKTEQEHKPWYESQTEESERVEE